MNLLTLSITGPGMDARCVLAEGEPELSIGRDAGCDIALPDPLMNISRKHLSLWLESHDLHFRVLSVVNGVTLSGNSVEAGGVGIFKPEDTLQLGDYILRIVHVQVQKITAKTVDPWDVLEEYAAPATNPLADAGVGDPFDDWLENRPLPTSGDTPTSPSLSDPQHPTADSPASHNLQALLSGLGLDLDHVAHYTPAQSFALGQLLRQAVQGLIELHENNLSIRPSATSNDRTMLVATEENPLTLAADLQAKLHYLFTAHSGRGAFMRPEKALNDLLGALHTHDKATRKAIHTLATGCIKEFAPDRIKELIESDKKTSSLFPVTRMWAAYARYYEDRQKEIDGWADQLVQKHFAGTYIRQTSAAAVRQSTKASPTAWSNTGF